MYYMSAPVLIVFLTCVNVRLRNLRLLSIKGVSLTGDSCVDYQEHHPLQRASQKVQTKFTSNKFRRKK